MELKNELVFLRRMTPEDTDQIIAWRNSREVMRNFLYRKPLDRETHLDWIHTKVEKGLVVQFIIGIVENGQEIGSTYLRDIDKGKKTAEFGIFIGKRTDSGHGYGAAAQELTLGYAYNELGLEAISARILEDNAASIRIHQKNGFHLLTDREEMMELDGEWRKVVFLMQRREDFERAQKEHGN